MSEEAPVTIRHSAILLTIAQRYPGVTNALELYEATRGAWIVGRRREKAEYARAVFQGVVQEVYRIHCWHPAGTLHYETRPRSDFMDERRWEFHGKVAEEPERSEYLGKYVGKGTQNPVRYVNI
ncbi:MAG: hypothetical protein R6X16_16500 [Anaerolineae bacterium]